MGNYAFRLRYDTFVVGTFDQAIPYDHIRSS